ncbi:hypothetical protein BBK14_32855 [Parafrankia soli]|uniref:Uncharacterized protein n=1 Tax=Parafrankia soli TaxID=2599596 RepID=A0A1S1R1I9_9ACTN|nr:hypothetical protein BBK14_32855 [Parafrankia soli]
MVSVIQTLQTGPQSADLLAVQRHVYQALVAHCATQPGSDPLTDAYRTYVTLTARRLDGEGAVDDRTYLHAAAALVAEVQLTTLHETRAGVSHD